MESKENKSAAGANDFTNERATNDKGKAVMKDEDDNQDIVDNRNTADNSNTVDKSMQTIVPVPKTLIVCCDGTGNDAVQVEKGDTLDDECRPIESLVALLGDELATTGPVHGLQIVNYIAGPGIGPYRHEKLVGGLIGKGVDQRAQSGYDWICRNWQKSDKICIIGFSRGAYIARLIQLMVTCLGALTVKGRRVLPIIVDQYWSIGFPGEYKPKGDELIFSSHEATREALKNLATYKSALISVSFSIPRSFLLSASIMLSHTLLSFGIMMSFNDFLLSASIMLLSYALLSFDIMLSFSDFLLSARVMLSYHALLSLGVMMSFNDVLF